MEKGKSKYGRDTKCIAAQPARTPAIPQRYQKLMIELARPQLVHVRTHKKKSQPHVLVRARTHGIVADLPPDYNTTNELNGETSTNVTQTQNLSNELAAINGAIDFLKDKIILLRDQNIARNKFIERLLNKFRRLTGRAY